jgi:hypothetical protein
MLALGPSEILCIAAAALLLATPCAAWPWLGRRSAAQRELDVRAEEAQKLREQLADRDAKYRQAQETIEQLRADLETRDATLFSAENGVVSLVSGHGVASPVSAPVSAPVPVSLFFPAVMDHPPLDRWGSIIEEGVRSRNLDACILAAELHVVAACELGEPDSRLLMGALKEVSRYLGRFLASAGRTPAQIVEELTAWAQQFNSAAQGRYSTQVPPLGGSVDLGYESPRPGVKTVSAVLTWAVRNAGGVAEFKAEVA